MGHPPATMRPSIDAIMWQITRGRGDAVGMFVLLC